MSLTGVSAATPQEAPHSPLPMLLNRRETHGIDASSAKTVEAQPVLAADPKLMRQKDAEPVTFVWRDAQSHSAFVEQHDVQLLITEHTSLDNTYLSTIGKHAKVFRWSVLVAGLAEPIDIEMHVDKIPGRSAHVSITANEDRVFPHLREKQSALLKEDFHHKWHFYGIPAGFREKLRFEIRPQFHGEGDGAWFPATLTDRRPDGTYEAKATVMDYLEMREVERVFVGLRPEDIRERQTKKPLQMSSQTLLLEVPQSAPHTATLKVLEEGDFLGQDMAHYFGRWTPNVVGAHVESKGEHGTVAPKLSPAIRFTVNMDKYGREIISTKAGHMELSRFLSGEVHAVDSHITPRLKKSWTIQIGPDATHKIEIERKNLASKIITVTIDGRKLLESMASDVNVTADEDQWNCEFRFLGDKFLEFDMENAYRYSEKAQKKMEEVLLRNYEKSAFPEFVTTPIRTEHRCLISMKNLASISDARLWIDGKTFNTLRPALLQHQMGSAPLSLPADIFEANYGIVVPRSVATNTVTHSVAQGLAWPGENLPPLQNKLREVVSDVAEQMPVIDKATFVSAHGKGKETLGNLSTAWGNFVELMRDPKEFERSMSQWWSCTKPTVDEDFETAA